ncbi:recombinase family protein [Patescibacteria group bacterium]|nr:recombinase family protein [Patescibacteria group bacterium]
MKIGYARVSTNDQSVYLQIDALMAEGCERIFHDVSSGANAERAGLDEALEYARSGDVLVIWKLDRLGRSLKHLVELANKLSERNIGFASIQEKIDTTTNGGKLIFHIFASLAEFEHDIIKERTMAGLKAARTRGRLGGRPKAMDKHKIKMAKALMDDRNLSVKEVCDKLGVGKTTLYKYLKED